MTKSNTKGTILIGDSCIGGFGVLNEIKKWSGEYRLKYLADYEKNPFGLKGKKEISEIVRSWFTNLVESNDVRLVVIACNTASIAAQDTLSKLSNDFNVPIVSMIEGVEKCVEDNIKHITHKKVAVMATEYTIVSRKYAQIIQKYNPKRIENIIGTRAERCVAAGEYNSANCKRAIEEDLLKYQGGEIETLILGCTCLPLITNHIKAIIGRDIVFLDPAKYVSELAKRSLEIEKDIPDSDILIFKTSSTRSSLSSIKKSSMNILNNKINVYRLELKR